MQRQAMQSTHNASHCCDDVRCGLWYHWFDHKRKLDARCKKTATILFSIVTILVPTASILVPTTSILVPTTTIAVPTLLEVELQPWHLLLEAGDQLLCTGRLTHTPALIPKILWGDWGIVGVRREGCARGGAVQNTTAQKHPLQKTPPSLTNASPPLCK